MPILYAVLKTRNEQNCRGGGYVCHPVVSYVDGMDDISSCHYVYHAHYSCMKAECGSMKNKVMEGCDALVLMP